MDRRYVCQIGHESSLADTSAAVPQSPSTNVMVDSSQSLYGASQESREDSAGGSGEVQSAEGNSFDKALVRLLTLDPRIDDEQADEKEPIQASRSGYPWIPLSIWSACGIGAH